MNDWDVIPSELLQATIWCGVKFSRKSDGGLAKFPIDLKSGGAAKSNDPTTWCDFETALSALERDIADGLMVRLPESVGMIDFDRIKDIGTNREVRSLVRQCGSYAEFSPSGHGLHILFKSSEPIPTAYKELFDSGVIEVYTERFCTITGDVHPMSRPELCDLTGFLKRQFPKLFKRERAAISIEAAPGLSLLGDDAVMRHGFAAKNGEKFAALHAGVWQDLNPVWTHSEADLAYVCNLVFWCGGCVNQIDRLFRQSALYRPKWNKTSYKRATINRALKLVAERYDPAKKNESDFERICRKIERAENHLKHD
jgi:putative DNA primase/helicase